MIPQAQIQHDMLTLLEDFTGCTCVPSNTTKHKPSGTYISFSVINTSVKKGTYAHTTITGEDGNETDVLFKPATQTWSFTAQSPDDAEAMRIAMLISDFFAEAKRLELEDKGIIIADVGAITPRDNLLTIEYEYRKGLDVKLSLNNVIEDTTTETINKATLSNDKLGQVEIEKE